MPGGIRRLTRAAAEAWIAEEEPITGGTSMPRTVADGRAQSRSATFPSPISFTPSSTWASLRNCSAEYSTPLHVWSVGMPSTVVSPSASWSVESIWIRPTTGSGAGPPNMPECIALASARTVTSTLVMPRSVVVSVGTPTAKSPVSTTRIVSARSRSAFSGTNASSPPVPCSSDPSQMILTVHGKPPLTSRSARSAVRCMTMLPLQSAEPRPYQRPSRSVSSHTGDVHASSPSGGWTS